MAGLAYLARTLVQLAQGQGVSQPSCTARLQTGFQSISINLFKAETVNRDLGIPRNFFKAKAVNRVPKYL